MSGVAVAFWVLAAIAVITSLLVITSRNPVASVLYLVVTFFCLAGLFVTLHSHFLAAIQVIVYAGAIMVLFLFVLMLLNVKREEDVPGHGGKALAAVAIVLVGLLIAQAAVVLQGLEPGVAGSYDASTRAMAGILFSPHFLYVFEATSVLILAALVGAVALAKKDA